MVQSNHSSYYKLLDASWKQYNRAHKGYSPAYCLVSEDVEDFLDAEQIAFLCAVVVDSAMPAQTMCLVHASNQT
jgi:hypothetical protein